MARRTCFQSNTIQALEDMIEAGKIAGSDPRKLYMCFGRFSVDISGLMCLFGLAFCCGTRITCFASVDCSGPRDWRLWGGLRELSNKGSPSYEKARHAFVLLRCAVGLGWQLLLQGASNVVSVWYLRFLMLLGFKLWFGYMFCILFDATCCLFSKYFCWYTAWLFGVIVAG